MSRIAGKSLFGNDNLDLTDNVNADLVFLGSSRCWAHFDPTFFKNRFGVSAVNIGIDGHSELHLIKLRLERYLATNRPPRYVILNFDAFCEYDPLNKKQNNALKDEYSRYAFFPSDANADYVEYFKYNIGETYCPSFAFIHNKIFYNAILATENQSYKNYGFARSEAVWDTVSRPVSNVMSKYLFNASQVDSIMSGLREIKQICNTNGIQLLCIQTPVYQNLSAAAQFKDTGIMCRRLSIPMIDLNISKISRDIGNFYNSNHLNAKGVNKMNEMLSVDNRMIAFINHDKR
ncbi:MAG: hypothetical protein EOO50_01565 [Flavobacterium sp.]|uniref:hypothetical protein n=1 Tax=Flavobacterium sp. TaxID=239 RepID=UPI0012263C94|nr:hypothetical protein [Flavobacterium sp.]RZJ68505.1 MAG: hypothetical protein EOO50_01565 [Flavobacterium sp.]